MFGFRKRKQAEPEEGIRFKKIEDTPVAVIDFETTGLTPGYDRVIEVSIARYDPGQQKKMVLNTLVNPQRPVAATEIHGITDEDVRKAPVFSEIAGDVVQALAGTVVAAYNVYFDIRFLEYELSQIGVKEIPPHFCLMYMRPMFGLGNRCTLEEACRTYEISFDNAHIAATDVMAECELFELYRKHAEEREIKTFDDLAKLKKYKFTLSFDNAPITLSSGKKLRPSGKSKPRNAEIINRNDINVELIKYWDTLTSVVSDFEVTGEELQIINEERKRLNLSEEHIRMLHARIFSDAINRYIDDDWLDNSEVDRLRRLHKCLEKLGWAPGN